MNGSDQALTAAMREQWGRLVSLLLQQFRRLDLVEDALADAFEAGGRKWPVDGVPQNPSAWLLTTARRRVVDRMRAETMARRRMPLVNTEARLLADAPPELGEPTDELLRLALMTTHPALDPAAASALTLRLVLGVATTDIARLFLVSDATMSARITRARKKIVAAGIPFDVPTSEHLPDRLDTLAQTAYLAFTAGYAPGSGPDLVRTELAGEAIRLVRTMLSERRDEPVLVALLALMLFHHSRRHARTDPAGVLVLLPDQDRTLWCTSEIAEATALLEHPRLTGPITRQAGAYLVQAQIAAEHASPPDGAQTRWSRIVELYDLLLEIAPSPGAALARVVAVAERSGPQPGLTELDALGPDQPGHRHHGVRAELLARAGRTAEASDAYEQAIAECRNEVEREHLVARRASLVDPR